MFLVSSLAVLSPQNENKVSPKSDVDLHAQQIARDHYVKRPRHASPAWEESPLAKAAITPEGYHSTLIADDWLTAVTQELTPTRADHAHNIHQICQALTQYLDHEKGIIRATWATLCATAGVIELP